MFTFVFASVVMRDIVQGLSARLCVDFCFMRDIVQGFSVRFCVDVCCDASYCSRT